MKKIFAIALALVMVLSMASAFAAVGNCNAKWDWNCTTSKCGVAKATTEMYVRANTIDGWQRSDCAAVVVGADVGFAVKVQFDNDVNPQWFEHPNTKLELSVSKVGTLSYGAGAGTAAYNGAGSIFAGKSFADAGLTSASAASGKTYYYDFASGHLVGSFDPATCVAWGKAQTTAAEACARVAYDFDGTGMAIDYGKYVVRVYPNGSIGTHTYSYVVVVRSGSNEGKFGIDNGVVKAIYDGTNLYGALAGDVFYGVDAAGNFTDTGTVCSFLKDMMVFTGLNFGTCVNADTIKANFGWYNKSWNCTNYNKNGLAVVNPECQVAIPKTGDVSVVAYAVMALVAAAGAMGLKK